MKPPWLLFAGAVLVAGVILAAWFWWQNLSSPAKRFAYSLLSEALAARGAIVVSADHPGDALADWLLGTNVDDRTNEINRVGDAGFLLDSLLAGPRTTSALPPELLAAIDSGRVVVVGHSYGAYTALATAAGVRGVDPDHRVGAVIGLQAYTRTMSDGALGRVHVPALLVIAESSGWVSAT